MGREGCDLGVAVVYENVVSERLLESILGGLRDKGFFACSCGSRHDVVVVLGWKAVVLR